LGTVVNAKTALVLSAGGIFGAYQAGVWKELSAYMQPDLIVGTSAGALNGWAIAGGCPPEELIRYWTDESAANFLRRRTPMVPWRGYFDPDSFSKQVREWFQKFRPRLPIGIVLTDALRLRPVLVRSEEITWEHLAAACAIPIVVPPVRIGGRWYVDGGLLDVMPVWAAAEMGASTAIAVNALPVLPSRVLRAGAKAIRWIRPKGPGGGTMEVIRIAPAQSLGTLEESVRWSRENVLRYVEQGAADARRVMAAQLSGRDWHSRVLQ